jgi:hypothetical protein
MRHAHVYNTFCPSRTDQYLVFVIKQTIARYLEEVIIRKSEICNKWTKIKIICNVYVFGHKMDKWDPTELGGPERSHTLHTLRVGPALGLLPSFILSCEQLNCNQGKRHQLCCGPCGEVCFRLIEKRSSLGPRDRLREGKGLKRPGLCDHLNGE